jgi:hypothetical protein
MFIYILILFTNMYRNPDKLNTYIDF